MFTNILQKNLKPISLAALFALLPSKEVGGRGGLRPGRQRECIRLVEPPSKSVVGAQTVLGPLRPGCWGLRALGQLPPHTPPQQSHTHTHTHTHTELHSAMANFTRHKRPAQLGLHSHNTIIQPRKTSPQSNTQPHCAQHQVTRVCIHS